MENKQIEKGKLERFNVWMYNFLAFVLPYTTSFPVAVLTAKSVDDFLHLGIYVSGVLVFGLESIGVLCTSLLVDSVVAWVRSRTTKSFAPIVLFLTVIIIYIRILISLNVTLEQAAGNTNSALADVIALLCLIPPISGVISGWNKLRIENKHKESDDRFHNESREDQLRREAQEREDKIAQDNAIRAEAERRDKLAFEREKIRIQEEQKTLRAKAKAEAQQMQPALVHQQVVPQQNTNTALVASQFKSEILNLLSSMYADLKEVPSVKQLADHFELDYEKNKGYISTLRKKWAEENNITLQRKKGTA